MITRFPPFDHNDPQVLANRLYTSVPSAYQIIIKTIFEEAQKQNIEIYLVGGIVRDLILGRPNFDFDFVCLAYAPKFARHLLPILQALPHVKNVSKLEHDAFGTATLTINFENTSNLTQPSEMKELIAPSPLRGERAGVRGDKSSSQAEVSDNSVLSLPLGAVENNDSPRPLGEGLGVRVESSSPSTVYRLPSTKDSPSTDLHIDLTTSRRETYAHPAALPTVDINPPASLQQDLLRRDFTINTMALSLKDGLIDPLNGLDDLREGLIRVLHNKSFEDDPTRLVRAVRYAARFGYHLEPHTEQLLKEAVAKGYFNLLSPERKRNELRRVLQEIDPGRAIAMLNNYGLLKATHPLLIWSTTEPVHKGNLVFLLFRPDESLAVLTAELGVKQTNQIMADLRFSKEEAEIPIQVARLIEESEKLSTNISNSILYRLLKPYLPKTLHIFQVLRPNKANFVHYYLNSLVNKKPKLGGDYLKSLGLKPGPQFKQILDALLDAVLNGQVMTEEQEAEFLKDYVKKLQLP